MPPRSAAFLSAVMAAPSGEKRLGLLRLPSRKFTKILGSKKLWLTSPLNRGLDFC